MMQTQQINITCEALKRLLGPVWLALFSKSVPPKTKMFRTSLFKSAHFYKTPFGSILKVHIFLYTLKCTIQIKSAGKSCPAKKCAHTFEPYMTLRYYYCHNPGLWDITGHA